MTCKVCIYFLLMIMDLIRFRVFQGVKDVVQDAQGVLFCSINKEIYVNKHTK